MTRADFGLHFAAMPALEPILSPILVGRDDVLELADSRFAEAAAGHGRVLLVAGEAGVGKTRLLRAIARRALSLEFDHFQGDLAPQDRDNPGALLLDMIRTMRSEPSMEDLANDLLRRFAEAQTDGGTYSRTLVVELVDRIRGAIHRPTLMVFEDCQWADDLSLEAIGELARRSDRHPVFIVCAYRLDEMPPGTPLRDWRARLLTQRLATEIRLERLTRDETATVTTLLLATGHPAPREIVDAIYARSDGLPLHIEELIATVRLAGPVDVDAIRDASVPDSIEDTILARAARRSPGAQAVGRAGAVLGRCFVPSILAGVMDVPEAELEDALRELVDHAILYDFGTVDEGYYDFRHQLLRDALYRSTPEADRRRFHARAGEFGTRLEGQTGVHTSLHYELAGLPEQAYRSAFESAQAAARVSAHREAFWLYRRAVANMPADLPHAERAELLDAYALEASAIEENEISERATRDSRQAYLAAGRPVAAARMMSWIATVWRRNGHALSERRRLVDETLAELQALPPGPERDLGIVELTYDRLVIAVDANDLGSARRTLDELLESLDGSDPDGYRQAVLIRGAMADVVAGDVDRGLETMARISREAKDAGAEETGVTGLRDTAVYALRAMDYEAGRDALAEGLVYADSIQQSHCAHVMSALAAELDWADGRWDEATRAAEQAIADHGCRRAPAMARWSLGWVAFGRGEVDTARETLESALAFGDASEMIEWRLPPRWGLAETALVAGDPATAIAHAETALELARACTERAAFAPFVVTGVRAYQASGRPSDAERWLAACTEHLAPTPAFAQPALEHGQGLVSLAAGSTGVARTCLEAAVTGWQRRGRIWEATWARLDLATALARSNRFAAAVGLAGQVRETATHLPSPVLLARADELVRSARGRIVDDEPWRPLTAREFEVARLVSEGLTNAEIAEALGIAPKTASSHVEHILAKLGASRRTEIATWASTVERSAAAR